MPLTGQPAETTLPFWGRFASAAPRRVQSFSVPACSDRRLSGDRKGDLLLLFIAFHLKFKRYLAVAVKSFPTNVKIWSNQPGFNIMKYDADDVKMNKGNRSDRKAYKQTPD